ncbi:hypothetical protein [uncultured Xylophilus sp.]|uniref:DUF4870 family protein n=1 Tax=uncultured Xylophilus sp. TaxID=296832 RepID=UPI0025FE0229|nr:hypothetical protein [uncultured Xylophilus sp.]
MHPDDRPPLAAPPQVPPPYAAADQSLLTVGWISYLLHLVVAVAAVIPGAQVSIAVLLVALVLDLVKRGDAEGTWQASHFRWRIRSVLWAAVLYILTAPLWLLLIAPGWIAWGVISIWFLYRIVLGMVRMNRHQPVEASRVL